MKLTLLLLAGCLSLRATATLVIASCTLASDGITLTCPTNASGAITPTTGLTGISIIRDQIGGPGITEPTPTVTALGTTITIVAVNPLYGSADNNAFIAVATAGGGSNFIDGAGNTPQGQSGGTAIQAINNSTWLAANGSTLQASARTQGGTGNNASTYFHEVLWQSADGCLEFNATATTIDVFAFEYYGNYVLDQDGVQVHDWGPNATTTAYGTLGAVTGLSGSHLYCIRQINTQVPSVGAQGIAAIRVVGTLGARPAARTLFTECGDSLVPPGGANPVTDSRDTHLYLSTEGSFSGVVDQHTGTSGMRVSGPGGLAINCPIWWSGIGSAPLLGYLRGGGNDYLAMVSNADLRTAWNAMIANAQGSSFPPTHLIALGIPTLIGADFTDYNIEIAGAAAMADIGFVDTTAWFSASQDKQPDGLHFNAAGEAIWGNRLAPINAAYLLGSSYTLTGPSSGYSGGPSTAFTVALRGGAFEVDSDSVARQTITLNDGGDGGTFTPSIGSPGTGPLAVAAATGSSWTFTYTPASTGSKSLTATTVIPEWLAPTGLSYASSTAPGALISTRVGSSERAGSATRK